MRLTIFKKGLILVAAPLLFQLALIGLVALMQRWNTEAENWSLHSKEVLNQTQIVLTKLIDAEMGSRGFILTGEAIFTEPYDRAVRDVPPALEQLETLTRDNPGQQAGVFLIAAKARRLLTWNEENHRRVRAGDREKVATGAITLLGKEQMDAIRQDIDAFLEEEQRLEQTREKDWARAKNRLNALLAAGTSVSLLGTLLLAFAFNRGISHRLATLAENAQRLKQGKELAQPLTGSDEITHLDHAFHDMAAELMRSARALREQSSLLQSILDNMGDGVVVADQNGKFLIFNPAAERILGVGATNGTPDALTEKYGVYLPDQTTPYPPNELPLMRAMHGIDVDDAEMFIRHSKMPEGTWVSATARPLLDADRIRRGGIVVVRDVNDVRRREEEIRKLNEELEQRVEERTGDLAEANRDLRQKNQENEMFVYSVSHDLRSPLVNLQGFSEELGLVCQDLRALLANGEVPPAVRDRGLTLLNGDMADSMRFIQSGVMRLSGIIDALLRLSRAGRVEYQWQRVEVKGVVARVIEALGGTIAQRGATVNVADLLPVWGDPTALEQIFANLINNALNYLDPRRPGVITVGTDNSVTADEPERSILLNTFFVRDNGLGIPEAFKAKLFQAFQRLHPLVAKGEGIGLVMVRRMVERHGGRIWLESAEGGGTTFFVTLPVPFVNGNANHCQQNAICAQESEQQNGQPTACHSVSGG